MKKTDLKKAKIESKKNKDQNQNAGSDQDVQAKRQENQVKVQVKAQLQDGPKKWYQQSDVQIDQKNKWQYLEHHGVTFPEPYIPKNLCPLYQGEEVKLNAKQEQLAYYWAQSMGTDYQNSDIYRKNFASQFLQRLGKEGKYTDFDKFDFSKIKQYQKDAKEQKANRTDQEKDQQKRSKQLANRLYGYAIVDDLVQKINGYQIQPPTLFKGRGKHPKAGILKPRIQPEDITINLAMNAPIPRCPIPGHSWGQIVSKKDSTWLCSYVSDAINDSSKHKYIFLAANSRFKGQNDRKKYQKARKLKNCIQKIREDYKKLWQDKDIRSKQIGTTTYLIDTLALRVGNQKGQDQADTVGCCSLRVQHVQLLQGSRLKLDFLGKDSMRYQNTVEINHHVWQNIKLFLKNKKPQDDLFDKIDAQALNDYLKSQMEGLTAKVFRTYNASITLQNQLNKANVKKQAMQAKIDAYQRANKQVAILCNHQKTPSKKLVQGLVKKQQYIQAQKEYLEQLKKHKVAFTAKKTKIVKNDISIEFQGLKPLVKKYPQTKEATETLIKKTAQKIEKQQKILKKRDESKQIALGTSKTNYNDPRISIAWCKKNEVRIQKIFTKNLLSKFLWAMYTEEDWQF